MIKKGSARKNILLLMSLSYGDMDKSIGLEMCGGNKTSYRGTLQHMQKKDEVETIYGENPRVLHIKKNGVDAISRDIPIVRKYYEDKRLSHRKSTSERHAMISRALYDMQLSDVLIDPREKVELKKNGRIDASGEYRAYAPIEYKEAIDNELKKLHVEIQGCRAHVVLVGQEKVFLVYAIGEKNIKYRKSVEIKIHDELCGMANLNRNVSDIFLVKDFSFVEKVIKNDEITQMLSKRNKEANLITSDMDGYVVPSGIDGSAYLKLILYPELSEQILGLARSQSEYRVINALPLNLRTCRQIKEEKENVTVLCTDEMKDIIDHINPDSNIHKFKIKKSDLDRFISEFISGISL